MISEIMTTEMIYNGLMQGFKIVFGAYFPVILPFLIGGTILYIVKISARSCIYNFELMLGSSKRRANKKANRVANIIDAISTLNDLSNIDKNEW